MSLKASFAKIVGTPAIGRDSWVYVGDGLFLVLEVSSPSDLPVGSLGKEIIDRLVSDYNRLSPQNLAQIKDLVVKIKVEEGVSFSLVLGVQVGEVLYLVCRGAGRAIMRRLGQFRIILSDDGSASGRLLPQDILLLTSPRFSEIVSFDEVKKTFDSQTVAELAESFTLLVHQTEDTSGVAALMLQYVSVTPDAVENSNKFLSFFSKRPEGVYLQTVQKEKNKNQRTVFGIVVILAILLVVSLIFGFGKRATSKKEAGFAKTYELTSRQYEEGKALLGLNDLRAVTLLSEAKTSLEKTDKDFGKGSPEAKKLAELGGKIEEALKEAKQEYKVSPVVFSDISLIKDGGEGSSLALSNDNLVILDSKNSSSYQINIKSKASQILAGGEKIGKATLMTLGGNRVFVLVDEGIIEINREIKTTKLVIKKDNDWGGIKAMSFFGDNLYLLDSSKAQIWKYLGAITGFSEKRNYLVEETISADISSLAIDGSVWLGGTGKISKYTQGRKEPFSIQGLNEPLGQNLVIFVSQETKDLYVLDILDKRVVVLEKNGMYKNQYQWPEINGVTDFAVSEEGKKIFLLAGSKIYQIEIK